MGKAAEWKKYFSNPHPRSGNNMAILWNCRKNGSCRDRKYIVLSSHKRNSHKLPTILSYGMMIVISMMTSWNGNIFHVTGHLCGEFTGPGEFPAQRPVTRSFDVFFDLHLNRRLSKQSWGWWFEMPSRPLWRHINAREHWPYYITNAFSQVIQSKSSVNVHVVSITTLRPMKNDYL